MKLVVRADDYGFTKIYNDSLLKTIENGIVTTVDLMLDTPGMEDACEQIKRYPWISVGWHTHFYWKPVLDPAQVSSLMNPETGRFKERVVMQNDIVFEEALAECRAQVEKCIRIMGKAPDVTDMHDSLFEKARRQVCDEYGIIYNFAEKHTKEVHIVKDLVDGHQMKSGTPHYPDEKYKSLDIYFPNDLHSLKYVHQDSAAAFLNYDPVQYYIDDPDHMAERKVAVQAWHPGYCDEFMRLMYDNPLFNATRPIDLYALCSDKIKAWVRDNNVELVNYRDAIHGTREYQNHLKAIGSDLAI
jgi:predicted glycoside hydrolase/deacetylase ChbG (UPF0249 family)